MSAGGQRSLAERAVDAAYAAVVAMETEEHKRDLLNAFSVSVIRGLADLVYVEHEGRRPSSVINDILGKL